MCGASMGFLVCGDEKKKVKKKMAFKMTVIPQWDSVCLDPVAGLFVLSVWLFRTASLSQAVFLVSRSIQR